MFRLPTNITLFILIWLTSLLSGGYCRTENNTLELHCNITTRMQDVNGTRDVTRQISAVNRCPKNYVNEDIIKKCENLIDSKLPGNELLFKPVVNSRRNITYWNEHCAACNYEKDVEYWSLWKKYELKTLCFIYKLEGQILKNIDKNPHEFNQNYLRKTVLLESKFDNSSSKLQCSMKENWPLNLVNFVLPCMTDNFRTDHNQRLDSCQYIKNNGVICLKMRYIVEGLDFIFGPNGRIDLFNNSSNKKINIDDEYVLQTGINNILFQCEPDKKTYKIEYWVQIVSMIVSIFFLSIYLFVNLSKAYFQSFPNKILYSYSIGLAIMNFFLIVVYLIFFQTCFAFFLVQFSWFFHFFWTMLLSLEFCRLTYCTLRKRRVSVGAQSKRFLVYCFFGFVLPTLLPIIYFYLLMHENHCQPVLGYIAVPCRPHRYSMAEYFLAKAIMVYHWSFLYLIPPLFLLQACVLIYITKCGSTRVRSTANRNHFVILMKMAYIMGAHWMLYEICVNVGYNSSPIIPYMSKVFHFCTDLQGVFVFFAFGVKKKMLRKLWDVCQCKCVTTEALQSGTEMTTVTLQSRTSLSDEKSMT